MAGHYSTLALFPVEDRKYKTRQPKWRICPICKTVYKGIGKKYGCSPACALQVRFWRCVDKTETCWLWQGEMGPGGYGRILDPSTRKHYMAHRYSYELHVGPVPEDLCLDHLCRVRHCVRPDHLEAVTMRENVRRGETPASANHKKQVCIHGHVFTDETTILDHLGHRHCRLCARRTQLAYYYRKQREKALKHGNDAAPLEPP
jgi:hypothetical protein